MHVIDIMKDLTHYQLKPLFIVFVVDLFYLFGKPYILLKIQVHPLYLGLETIGKNARFLFLNDLQNLLLFVKHSRILGRTLKKNTKIPGMLHFKTPGQFFPDVADSRLIIKENFIVLQKNSLNHQGIGLNTVFTFYPRHPKVYLSISDFLIDIEFLNQILYVYF